LERAAQRGREKTGQSGEGEKEVKKRGEGVKDKNKMNKINYLYQPGNKPASEVK